MSAGHVRGCVCSDCFADKFSDDGGDGGDGVVVPFEKTKATKKKAESEFEDPAELSPPSEPVAVARELAAAKFTVDEMPTLRRWRGGWWQWSGTHWCEVEKLDVEQVAYEFTADAIYIDADKMKPWAPNRYKIADLLAATAARSNTSKTITMPSWLPDKPGPAATEYVSLKNGLLHIPTEVKHPHTVQMFNGTSVPFDYEPDAAAPAGWLHFLGELWPGDPAAIAALQQFFGYVLSGRTDLHKILLIVGPTRAGKGVIARILKALIGAWNAAGPTFASLGTNFGLQPLIGKSLAIVSDARLGGTDASQVVERLLSISGEDMLTIDRKYLEPWTGTLSTRFVVISNELPRFGDASGAIAGRFVILTLTRSWLGNENTNLTDDLLEELPGILNWALDGLRQVQADGKITVPSSSDDAISVLADLVSPVSAFVRDMCTRDPQATVSCDAMYAAWKIWAADHGHREGSNATFGNHLRAAAPGVGVERPRDGEARIRVYAGITLK